MSISYSDKDGGMRAILLVLLFVLMASVNSGCSDDPGDGSQEDHSSEKPSVHRMTEEAKITAQTTKTDDGRLVVSGSTNLPDGTELLISVSDDTTGFTAQSRTTAKDGGFSGVPLGPKSGLAPANYTVEVLMPVSTSQPESVQSIIGRDGSNLSGPLVEAFSWGGKFVKYSFKYTVGSPDEVENTGSEHAEMVSGIKSRITELLKAGRSMEQYRNTDDLSGIRTCGEMRRRNQAEAKQLRSDTEALSTKYYDLKVAAIEAFSCVSCSGNALEACDRADEALTRQ